MKRIVASAASLLTVAGTLVPTVISDTRVAAADAPAAVAKAQVAAANVQAAATDAPAHATGSVAQAAPLPSDVDPGEGKRCRKRCWAHRVVFRGKPMLQWLKFVRHSPGLKRHFDMSNNGCSVPDKVPTFDYDRIFRRACVVHDFGYRNFGPGEYHVKRKFLTKPQRDWGRHTDKEFIDRRFKQLMDRICVQREDRDGWWDACEKMAEIFYRVVRHGGNDAWNNG